MLCLSKPYINAQYSLPIGQGILSIRYLWLGLLWSGQILLKAAFAVFYWLWFFFLNGWNDAEIILVCGGREVGSWRAVMLNKLRSGCVCVRVCAMDVYKSSLDRRKSIKLTLKMNYRPWNNDFGTICLSRSITVSNSLPPLSSLLCFFFVLDISNFM